MHKDHGEYWALDTMQNQTNLPTTVANSLLGFTNVSTITTISISMPDFGEAISHHEMKLFTGIKISISLNFSCYHTGQ